MLKCCSMMSFISETPLHESPKNAFRQKKRKILQKKKNQMYTDPYKNLRLFKAKFVARRINYCDVCRHKQFVI